MAKYYTLTSFLIPVKPSKAIMLQDLLAGKINDLGAQDEEGVFVVPGNYSYNSKSESMWISGSTVNPESLAKIIAEAQRMDIVTEPVWFTWANVCDTPEVNAFSGGMSLICAGNIYNLDQHEWLNDLTAKLGIVLHSTN